MDASISSRNAPVEIIFMFFAPYKYTADYRLVFDNPRKTKIVLFSKVKIHHGFVNLI